MFKRLSFPTNYYQQNYATGSADRVLVHDRLVFPNNFFERNSLRSSIPRERVPGPKASNSNSKSSSFSFGKSVEMRCFRCLSPDHHVANCCNQVRCKSCFFLWPYGPLQPIFSNPGTRLSCQGVWPGSKFLLVEAYKYRFVSIAWLQSPQLLIFFGTISSYCHPHGKPHPLHPTAAASSHHGQLPS